MRHAASAPIKHHGAAGRAVAAVVLAASVSLLILMASVLARDSNSGRPCASRLSSPLPTMPTQVTAALGLPLPSTTSAAAAAADPATPNTAALAAAGATSQPQRYALLRVAPPANTPPAVAVLALALPMPLVGQRQASVTLVARHSLVVAQPGRPPLPLAHPEEAGGAKTGAWAWVQWRLLALPIPEGNGAGLRLEWTAATQA